MRAHIRIRGGCGDSESECTAYCMLRTCACRQFYSVSSLASSITRHVFSCSSRRLGRKNEYRCIIFEFMYDRTTGRGRPGGMALKKHRRTVGRRRRCARARSRLAGPRPQICVVAYAARGSARHTTLGSCGRTQCAGQILPRDREIDMARRCSARIRTRDAYSDPSAHTHPACAPPTGKFVRPSHRQPRFNRPMRSTASRPLCVAPAIPDHCGPCIKSIMQVSDGGGGRLTNR